MYSNIINLFTDSGKAERLQKSGEDKRGRRSDFVRRYTLEATFIIDKDANTYDRTITYIGSLSWNPHLHIIIYVNPCLSLVTLNFLDMNRIGGNILEI